MAKVKALLVDDEVPFVETMGKRLRKRDLEIETAFGGESAIAKLDSDSSIEVVILDVKMPGMDGIETLQVMRRKFPLVEVIMLTGHATVESAIDGMKMGAFDYLMKPCDMDILIDKVEEAADKKRAHEEKIMEARIMEITARKA